MDNIKGLIPEIYYDMIARVAAGVPLVAIIVSPHLDQMDKLSNSASFVLLVGLGYIAGHVLTTISVGVNLILWNPLFICRGQRWASLKYGFKSNATLPTFDVVYQRIDWAAKRDASAGAILKKMEAGAALSDNLLSAWLVILVYHWLGGTIGWAMNFGWWNLPVTIAVTFALVVSVYARRSAFIVRQDRILHQLDDPVATAGVPK
ncbi:MAG TPA: hypothetical protein VGF97_00115 [Rhizomicrobium sp.]|jgi:hypothetical protein